MPLNKFCVCGNENQVMVLSGVCHCHGLGQCEMSTFVLCAMQCVVCVM